MADRSLTIRFLGDPKAFQRSAKDAISALDDTGSAGERVALQMKAMADKMDADMRDAASAVGVLETAMGTELVESIRQAGGSIDRIVGDLKAAGLTYDDVRGDADALADAIRRVDETGGHMDNLKAGADDAEASLKKVHTEGDNSKSVLANMVGNSVQDLGALGGVAGTAGMALGQLGEYATEGNISLGGLAKTAGPMIAVTAAVMGVAAVMKALGADAKKTKEETELLVGVQRQLKEGKFEDAAVKLEESYRGTIAAAKEYGLSTRDVTNYISDQKDNIGPLTDRLAELKAKQESVTEAERKEFYGLEILIGNLKDAREHYEMAGDQIKTTDDTVRDLTVTLKGNQEAAKLAASSGLVPWSDAATDAALATRDAESASRALIEATDALYGRLNAEDAWATYETAMWNYHATTDQSEQDTRDYIRAIADLVGGLKDVPDETKASIIAALDEDNVALAESRLNWLARTRTVNIGGIVVGSELRNAKEGLAAGGPARAGETYLIGEKGPELLTMGAGGGGFVTPNHELGGNSYNIVVQVPVGANLPEIGRSTVEAIKAYERQSGKVFAGA
jgi:hypothetical protein